MPSDIILPTSGELNWDGPLNTALTQVDTDALTALTNIVSHAGNVPADPHGDRAFATSLFTPITSGTNLPNGYVKLDGNGHIPANLISGTSAGGLYTNVYDAVGLFGLVQGGIDTSTQLQNALTAAANAGGGIVYVGPGTYSLGNYVVIGNNTWLLLAEGAILQRIQGATNPPYLVSNIKFGTTNTPSTNFKISGGKFDAVGTQNLTSACTPIFMIQANKVEVRDVWINNVFNNPAIEINGSTVVRIDFVHFAGTGSNSTQPTVPAIRINCSETITTPAGLGTSFYNGAISQTIKITDCDIDLLQGTTFGSYGLFCGTDLIPVHHSKDIIITACSTEYNSNNAIPVNTSQWIDFFIDNCSFNETAGQNVGSAWQTMSLKSGWGMGQDDNNNNYPPAYRLMPDGTLAIRGILSTPNNYNSGSTFCQLPAAFANTQPNIPTAAVTQINGNNSGRVSIDQNANLKLTSSQFGNNYNIAIDSLLRI